MLTVFSCDVSDDRRRREAAKAPERKAARVQYSVFEVRMTKAQAEAPGQRLAAMPGDGDSLRVWSVGADGFRRSRVNGDGPGFEPEEGYWLV